MSPAPGSRAQWRLLGWWTLFTVLATLWWWLPLLLLGRYSVPFLDYIENATITTVPTGLARTLVGTSDWVAYFAGIDYTAGQQLVTTPLLVLMRGGGRPLAWSASRSGTTRTGASSPWRLLIGLVLVGFGYAGDLAGFFAADRAEALDGALAPLRNLHKFDVVLRIPLVLGLAHVHGGAARTARGRPDRPAAPGAVLAVGPWPSSRSSRSRCRGRTTASRRAQGVDAVPAYWTEVASYLPRPTTAPSRSWSPRRRSASTPGATPTTTSSRDSPRARGRCAT